MRHILSPRHLAARVAGAALLAAVVAGAASADTVVLNNGRRLKGTIVSEDEKVVVLQTDGMGKMKIARGDVKEILRSRDAPPALSQGPDPAPAPAAPPATDPAPAVPPDAPAPQAPTAPAPSPAAPPTSQPAPAPASGAFGPVNASATARKGPWKVAPGRLADVLADLARQAGLTMRVTPAAEPLLAKARDSGRSEDSDATFGETVADLLRFRGGGTLVGRVLGNDLVVGMPWEIAGPAPTPRGRGVAWNDGKGDTETAFDPPGWTTLDATEVSIEGKDGRLVVRIAFADDVNRVLAQRTATGTQKGWEVLEVYLDVDDDPSTGGAPSWAEGCKGFEWKVDVATGMELKDLKNGHTFKQWGNIATIAGVHSVVRSYATYSLDETKRGGGVRLTLHDDSETSPEKLTTISGREIVAAVPYSALGVKAGARVRACYLDSREEMFSDARISQAGTVVLE